MTERADIQAPQVENARLLALLELHGIAWRSTSATGPQPPTLTERTPAPVPTPAAQAAQSNLSTAEKVALFRQLFRGRTDVYPVRWESMPSGKSGYAPACANEWRAGVCEKPRIKCGDCGHRLLLPLPGHSHHLPHLLANAAAQAGVLRPLVSQPGHDAQKQGSAT